MSGITAESPTGPASAAKAAVFHLTRFVSQSVGSTIAGIDGRLLTGKKLSQARDLFGRPALRGQMGGLLLERRPHFNRFVETSPLHPASEQCRKLARRTHVSAIADARFDHPGMN